MTAHRQSSGIDVNRLLQEARAGSKDALGKLLELCRSYLLAVANRDMAVELRAKAGASDLVQEALLEASQQFAGFHGESEADLLRWLGEILRHNLLDFTRQYREGGKRRIAREVGAAAPDDPEMEARTPSPSSKAARHEEEEVLERALQRLPERYRNVIVWHHREQRSHHEIGQLLGVSAEAARQIYRRALATLTREVKSGEGGERDGAT